MNRSFKIIVLPKQEMTWPEFIANTPARSIALDGMVKDPPAFDPKTLHFNFDHHHGVVRDATMSTAMQVEMAIKTGLMETLSVNGEPQGQIYINDTDEDTALAVWLLLNHKLFEGTRTVPPISRLLNLSGKWDITGGSYPIALDADVAKQCFWVFEPYTNLRKSGELDKAGAQALYGNLLAVMSRITDLMMGQAGQIEPDLRHEILHSSPNYKIVREIGGTSARKYLFGQGMNAFIGIVSEQPDGRKVVTIGRRSQYIPFPVEELYAVYNLAEGLTTGSRWSGSSLIGGSPRLIGTRLTWQQLRDLTDPVIEAHLAKIASIS